MDNPEQVVTELQDRLTRWRILGRKAQLEAAMPLLDSLVQSKVEYKILASLLQQGGLDINADNLRQAISRWRKRQVQREVGVEAREVDQPAAAMTSTNTELATDGAPHIRRISAPALGSTRRPSYAEGAQLPEQLTKARLKEIREQHIDLEAITREARKLQGEA